MGKEKPANGSGDKGNNGERKWWPTGLYFISGLIGTLHALAGVKNTLWAHPWSTWDSAF
jgi:hypothetical protein